MAGRRWKGSILLVVAAVQGMDRVAAAAAEELVAAVGWTKPKMMMMNCRLREKCAGEELGCFEKLSPLYFLGEAASLEAQEVPWAIWRV